MKRIYEFHEALEYLINHPKGNTPDLLKERIDFDLFDNLVNRRLLDADGYKYRLTEDGFNYYVENVYQPRQNKGFSKIIKGIKDIFH